MQSKITKFLTIPILFGMTLLLDAPTHHFAFASETSTASSTVMFNLNPTLGITVEPSVSIDIDPNATGAISQSTTDLTIASNNPTGYKMYLSTVDGTGNLTHEVDANNKIPSTANPLTLANFVNNTWGYNLIPLSNWNENNISTYTYSAVPTAITSEPQGSADSAITNTYKLSFGAKVDTTLPAGKYSNIVQISVIANPTINTISTIASMQEITPEICAASVEHETKQLIDIRDGKSYTVKKIGSQCWMTQNLQYDGSNTTADNTDINDTAETGYTTIITAQPDATSGYSYTEPYYYYKTSWTADQQSQYGYLYNYPAATLNNTQNRTSGDAPNSICPKGWKLPTGGSSTTSDWNTLSMTLDGVTGYHQFSASGAYTNWTGPWSGVLSGRWYNGFNYQGSYGYWWSSSVSNSDRAYYTDLYSSYVDSGTTYGVSRYYGYAVRCVAR